MRKASVVYLITLAAILLGTLCVYLLYNHQVNRAQNTAIVAATAGAHNHGVARAHANNVAGTANMWRMWLVIFLAASGSVGIFGAMEFIILPVLSLSRVGAMTRVTYYEGLLQPFTLIVFFLAIAAILITAFVPFNTFGDDTKMYRDVALSFALMFVLVIMVFATGKVIDEEIENRTMLTLMSKPVARWQVILGKYLGVVCLILVTMFVCIVIGGSCAWLRYFSDQRISLDVASFQQMQVMYWHNDRAILAMIPAFILQFMELSTLAAISTAIATRFSLALNMTVIVLLYIIANLTRYVSLLHMGSPWQGMAEGASYLLPYLSNFDLNSCLVYRNFSMSGHFVPNAPSWGEIWEFVGLSCLYGLFYIGAALSLAVAMFRNRELT